jgi:methylaspartate ammonia-lyase
MSKTILNASLSHYRAERDKAIAELDIYLNRPVGVGEHASVVDEVIKLFKILSDAESAITTIESIVRGNENAKNE